MDWILFLKRWFFMPTVAYYILLNKWDKGLWQCVIDNICFISFQLCFEEKEHSDFTTAIKLHNTLLLFHKKSNQ